MTNHYNDGQWNVSHRLSRRLNNGTGQCPVVCPSHVDNDGTVARGVSTSRCPVICPVVPLCRHFLDQPSNSAFKPTRIYCHNGIIQEYACKRDWYNAVNTSACREQYLTAHIETNNTDYGHASTNHVRVPGLEGREIDSRLPVPDTLRCRKFSIISGIFEIWH